jgi:hypothetical protein
VIYFADVGKTGMSCDSCHVDGHGEGLFYTKTGMMRLWRSPTVRGVRDVPPYFNPPGHATIEDMFLHVGSRNRFQNPALTTVEVERGTRFVESLTLEPQPHRDAQGALLPVVPLPDAPTRTGRPREGLRVFLQHCAACHPPPLFSTDQDAATRRRFLAMHSPAHLPLRTAQQDLRFSFRTPPSLLGAFDVWPMFLSGAAGFAVEGNSVVVAHPHALSEVVRHHTGTDHGDGSVLTPQEQDDVISFVMSL